jgi:hypothetical protein
MEAAAMRHFVKFDLVPLLSMLAVCFFPCFFLYAQNADEVAASTMVPFLVVFLLNSLVIFAIAAAFLRNVSRAAFLTDLSMLVVINFCLLAEKLKHVLPFLRDRYLLAVLLLLLLLLALVLWRKKPDLRIGCLLVLIAFGSMIFMNLVFAVPTMLRGHKEARAPQPAPPQENAVVFNENRPNVYYFIFDEYGGYENLLHYYDYDNSPFLSALEDRGFNVSLESRNTEAVYTDTIVTNLLNLDYVVRSEDSGHKKAQLRDNTYLSQLFRQNGYHVNLINHVDYLGTSGLRVLTSHQTRRTISEYLMRNSIYHKFSALQALLERFFVIDYGKNYRSSLDNAMEAGLGCWQETEDGPTLTIGYFVSPFPYYGRTPRGSAALRHRLELAGPQPVSGPGGVHERLHSGAGGHPSGA